MQQGHFYGTFYGTFPIFGKSLIRLVPDRRKNLVQKEAMKIGYARVSTEEQNLDLQIGALAEFERDLIQERTISILSINRSTLQRAMNRNVGASL